MLSACSQSAPSEPSDFATGLPNDAAADIIAPDGETIGKAIIADSPGAGIIIRLFIHSLTPGWHGAHLHKVGDCSDGADGFKVSSSHVNPDGVAHGFLNELGPEPANLPNIFVDRDGTAVVEMYAPYVTLTPSEASFAVLGDHHLLDADGFSIIVHAERDDHKSQPIGGSGARVGCAAFRHNG